VAAFLSVVSVVADPEPRHILDPCDQIPDLAHVERIRRSHLRREEADVVDLGLGAGLHRADRLPLRERAVDHADIRDHAPVLIELGVEDERPGAACRGPRPEAGLARSARRERR